MILSFRTQLQLVCIEFVFLSILAQSCSAGGAFDAARNDITVDDLATNSQPQPQAQKTSNDQVDDEFIPPVSVSGAFLVCAQHELEPSNLGEDEIFLNYNCSLDNAENSGIDFSNGVGMVYSTVAEDNTIVWQSEVLKVDENRFELSLPLKLPKKKIRVTFNVGSPEEQSYDMDLSEEFSFNFFGQDQGFYFFTFPGYSLNLCESFGSDGCNTLVSDTGEFSWEIEIPEGYYDLKFEIEEGKLFSTSEINFSGQAMLYEGVRMSLFGSWGDDQFPFSTLRLKSKIDGKQDQLRSTIPVMGGTLKIKVELGSQMLNINGEEKLITSASAIKAPKITLRSRSKDPLYYSRAKR